MISIDPSEAQHAIPGGGTRVLPLVRHLSRRVTPYLEQTALTPNHVTGVSLATGLAGAASVAQGGAAWTLAGALLLLGCYVLDNCDGELARRKGMTSRAGMIFDTVVDGCVHAAFFLGLALGTWHAHPDPLWLWLGAAAAAGTALSTAIAARRELTADAGPAPPPATPARRWSEQLMFAFRELSRADFCFIVLALALLDLCWLLIPAAAVGAQVYWLTGCLASAGRYHV